MSGSVIVPIPEGQEITFDHQEQVKVKKSLRPTQSVPIDTNSYVQVQAPKKEKKKSFKKKMQPERVVQLQPALVHPGGRGSGPTPALAVPSALPGGLDPGPHLQLLARGLSPAGVVEGWICHLQPALVHPGGRGSGPTPALAVPSALPGGLDPGPHLQLLARGLSTAGVVEGWICHGLALKHLVVMSCYQEPLNLINTTMDTIKEQTEAKNLFVVVGMEEVTPEKEEKKEALLTRYHGHFYGLIVTFHPRNVPGEIPGKCSNSNYATREGVKALWRLGHRDPKLTTVTTMDTDNLFHGRYFEFLGFDFFRRSNRHEVIWQAPLYYNLHLDKRPFFVRVTGILRAFFMTGVLIPQNINPMSIFSMSLELCEKGGFFHPTYQMHEIVTIVHSMIAIGKRVKIALIPYPVVSGPTSGETWAEEVLEWARQARRWTVGAAEVFHYFCVKFSSFKLHSAITYAIHFTHYYGLVLCGSSLLNLSGLIASIGVHASGHCVPQDYLPSPGLVWLPMLGLGISYLVFAIMFLLDQILLRYTNVVEHVHPIRNFLHWLSTPAVLLAYSFVEFYAIAKMAILGKDVCIHDASDKDNLATNEENMGTSSVAMDETETELDSPHTANPV